MIDSRDISGIVTSSDTQAQNPLEVIEKSGIRKGQLNQAARRATDATLDVRLMERLLKEKVGTKKMEWEALKLWRESQKGIGEGTGQNNVKGDKFIQSNRKEEYDGPSVFKSKICQSQGG